MREIEDSSGVAPKKSWKWGCVGLIALCSAFSYVQWFFWGYVPLSTLPTKKEPDVCGEKLLWPPSGNLPAYSPNNKYYIDIVKVKYRIAWELRLYEADSDRFLGGYSYRSLHIFCWAEDSNGIYLADFVQPGFGLAIAIPDLPPGSGVIEEKKVLVPCQTSLEGVSLLPSLYWEMRCAFPEPYGFAAIWLPLVVLIALIAMGSWGGSRMMLWLWRRWVRPWWYGE